MVACVERTRPRRHHGALCGRCGQQSLLVGVVLNDPSGMVSGKANIREYFRKVIAAYPIQPGEPGPQLLGVFRGVNSLIVHFETRGMYAAEFMELDARGKVRRGRAHFLG